MLLNCGVGEDSWLSFYCKEIPQVHPKEDQSWICIGRTDVEAESAMLWPPDGKSWLIWNDLDAGKDWRQEERGWQMMRWLDGITDSMDEIWVNSRSWWWTERPAVLQSMGSKESDTTEWLNWPELNSLIVFLCVDILNFVYWTLSCWTLYILFLFQVVPHLLHI